MDAGSAGYLERTTGNGAANIASKGNKRRLMTKLNGNIFSQAGQLLREKSGLELTEAEALTVNAAVIPLDLLPEFNDKTTDEGLGELAKMFDGQNSIRPGST